MFNDFQLRMLPSSTPVKLDEEKKTEFLLFQ